MSTKNTFIISFTLIICATLGGLLFWNQLPDPVASHWGLNDQVNGTMPKFWGVFLMPLISIGMMLLFLAIPLIDPLKANVAKFRESFNTFIVLMIVFLIYIHGLTLSWNLGYTGIHMSTAILPAIGLLFFFIGDMMSKTKRNYFIGIRTPWTLASDTVWDETHRIGGILFKISALLAMASILLPPIYAFILLLFPLLGSTFFTIAYSYVLFQREAKNI